MKTTTIRLPKTGDTIEIVPGKEIPALEIPREAVPRYGFVQLMRQLDGTYLPVLKTWGETVRLTVALSREMGIDVDYNTIVRLYNSEFIRGRRIAPNTILLDLKSIYEHLEATTDPEFWTPERIRKYRQSL